MLLALMANESHLFFTFPLLFALFSSFLVRNFPLGILVLRSTDFICATFLFSCLPLLLQSFLWPRLLPLPPPVQYIRSLDRPRSNKPQVQQDTAQYVEEVPGRTKVQYPDKCT